jgi:hypothetical protein
MCSTTTSDISKLDPYHAPLQHTAASGSGGTPSDRTTSLARRVAAPVMGKPFSVSNKKEKKKLTAHGVAVSPRSTVAKKSKLSSMPRGPRITRSVVQPSWSQNIIISSSSSSSSSSIIPLDMPAIHIHRECRTQEEQDMEKTFGWDDFPVLRRMMVPIQP